MKKKFLVLKSHIDEVETNLKQQFFRRNRYKIMLKHVLDYITINEKLNFLTLNRFVTNVINEKGVLEKIKIFRNDFLLKATRSYKQDNLRRFFEMSFLQYGESDEDKLLKLAIIPPLFFKFFVKETRLQIPSIDIKELNIDSRGGGDLMAYYFKNSSITEINFISVHRIRPLICSIYFPQINTLQEIYFVKCDSPMEKDDFDNLFRLPNLTILEYSESSLNLKLLCESLAFSNSRLETLNLHKLYRGPVNFVDSFANLLKKTKNLKYFKISYCRIDCVALKTLADCLDKDSILEELCLSNNSFRDSDFKIFFEQLTFSRPCKLKTLMIGDRFLGRNGFQELGRFIKRKDCPLLNLEITESRYSRENILKFLNYLRPTSKISILKFSYLPNQDFISEKLELINKTFGLSINSNLS
jgi:hypothetical protein